MRTLIKIMAIVFAVMLLMPSVLAYGENSTWDCPECGKTGNTGNFCGGCAHPAPWVESGDPAADELKPYKEAVDKGYYEDLLELGQMYLEGVVIKRDAPLAIHYYERAVEKGIEKAILRLGEIYERGFGVEIDTAKAVTWYRKAAANGNETAKECLKRLGEKWDETNT